MDLDEIQDIAGNEPIFARTIFDSLARRYADVLRNLESLTGRTFDHITILGGGSRNALLRQLTETSTGLPVLIGEAEELDAGKFCRTAGCPRRRQVSRRLCAGLSRVWAADPTGKAIGNRIPVRITSDSSGYHEDMSNPYSQGQTLLIDADDTLWENNIYFERAIAAYISYLDHLPHTPEQVRQALNQAERDTILSHGYGLTSFTQSLITCFERLSSTPVTERHHRIQIHSFAQSIAGHEIEAAAGSRGAAA